MRQVFFVLILLVGIFKEADAVYDDDSVRTNLQSIEYGTLSLAYIGSACSGNLFGNIWNSIKTFGTDLKSSFQSLSQDVEAWDCGADKFWITKLITQRAAKRRCHSIFEEINKACRYHDFCYSNGLDGQTTCDDRFCSQLFSLKIPDPIEQQECSLPRTMCDAVRLGGHLVYRNRLNRK